MKVFYPHILLALAVGLSACASAPAGPPPAVAQAVISDDARFQECERVAITVDRRSDFRAELAGFLDRARDAKCQWGQVVVASNQAADWGKSQDYVKVRGDIRDYARSHALPWALQDKEVDRQLSVHQLRVALLAPTNQHQAEIQPAPNPAMKRTLAMQALAAPQDLFSSAIAEGCFSAALERRAPSEALDKAGYQQSGWVGGRHGTGNPADQGWLVAPGKRVYVVTRPNEDVCIVSAEDGDSLTLAAHALGALDAVAPAPYAGDCPVEYHCRALPDGRIMLLSLRLRGQDIPQRYQATSSERVGTARALAGAMTATQLAELSARVNRTRPAAR